MKYVFTQILQDEIDILVDLAGTYRWKPSGAIWRKSRPHPSHLSGYYGTTGLPQVDYWVTDDVLHPLKNDLNDPCTEERWRLDRCYVSYRPLPTAPPVKSHPALKHKQLHLAVSIRAAKLHHKQHQIGWLCSMHYQIQNYFLKAKIWEQVERERILNAISGDGISKRTARNEGPQSKPGRTSCFLQRCGHRAGHLPLHRLHHHC